MKKVYDKATYMLNRIRLMGGEQVILGNELVFQNTILWLLPKYVTDRQFQLDTNCYNSDWKAFIGFLKQIKKEADKWDLYETASLCY